MKHNLRKCLHNSSGASAVEFAIVFPMLIMTTLTMIGYGIYLSAATSVQQISADAARTAIAGLSAAERQAIAIEFVAAAISNRPFIDPSKVKTTVEESKSIVGSLSVRIEYDAENLPIWSLFSHAMPESHIISRTSMVRIGGY